MPARNRYTPTDHVPVAVKRGEQGTGRCDRHFRPLRQESPRPVRDASSFILGTSSVTDRHQKGPCPHPQIHATLGIPRRLQIRPPVPPNQRLLCGWPISLGQSHQNVSLRHHPWPAPSSPYSSTYLRMSESEMMPLSLFSSSTTISLCTRLFRIVSKIESSRSPSQHV